MALCVSSRHSALSNSLSLHCGRIRNWNYGECVDLNKDVQATEIKLDKPDGDGVASRIPKASVELN